MSADIRIRHISARDWPDIRGLETSAYQASGLSEGEDALRSRAALSPLTCFVLDAGRRTAGYLIALPYPLFGCPDLTRPESVGHRDSRNLHLHDLVVAKDFRRHGLATRLVRHLTLRAVSLSYERISLVAVAGSGGFWSANGYQACPGAGFPAGYGEDAVYMSRALRPGGHAIGNPSTFR
ncbi:GNAT family N-acetyltransferase [Amycolatopsis roodepoortensis]|uniref:Ornithine decarboxylase n=1 Tax=Amycolatopsis roodepoortensis TaxID=700274 RepID=A0ABR9L181_9PSEU|nr:GNAT family N-acetyltransferase [Amycolatopsis roodepoortensis]MBE1574371.1 ornithine decarboxylase [Amycolatopsis roodepoortensis]